MHRTKKPLLAPLIGGLFKKLFYIVKENFWISTIMLAAIVATFALVNLFENPSSLSIVNYALAIVGALAGICFSWARNFDKNEDDKVTQIRITELGEILLFAGIIFMFSSAVIYLGVLGSEYASSRQWLDNLIFYSSLVASILRVIAFFMFCISVIEICQVIMTNILSRDIPNKYIDRSKDE